MPNGYPNGSSEGTPPPAPPGKDFPQTGSSSTENGNIRISARPTTSITKSVSYVASGADSNQILAIAGTDSSTVTTADAPRAVAIHNTGKFSVVTMLGYQQYSDEDTEENTVYLHTLLLPGETIAPNMRGLISTQGSVVDHTDGDFADRSLWNLDGEVVDYTAPNVNLYTDSTAKTTEGFADDDDTTITFDDASGSNIDMFRVNDLIRLDDEVCRIISLTDTVFTVDRALYGTAKADHTNNTAIRFPFFNEYYDFDRVLSGSSQLVQTDAQGRFKSSNFFGYGRVNSTSAPFGLVPGTCCIRFYSSAYQEIPMGGTGVAGGTGGSNIPITSSTSSQLSTSTEFSLNLTIDDSSATTVSFTTSSSNVNFGGTGGIVSLLQDAINTATRTAGNNLFGYSCSVGIVDSKLRFTSNSHLSPHDGTNGSKMEVKDGAGGTNVLTGAAGIFPDINNSIAAIKPTISPVSVYDTLTYAKSSNMGGMCYDNGWGELIYNGSKVGNISYETGSFNFSIPSLPNSEFEISLAHGSPFAGKLDTTKEDTSTITAIHANVINKNITGEIEVKLY